MYSRSVSFISALFKLLTFRVDYLVELTIDVVNHGLGRPPNKRGRSASRNIFHTKFHNFVDNLVHRAQVTVPMLLVTAAYITRARPFISIARPDWAFERVFLGALIVATKVSLSYPYYSSKLTDLRSTTTIGH